jgi:membrane protein
VNAHANHWPTVLRNAYVQFLRHDGLLLAAAIAYFAFFSLFSLVVLLISFLSVFFKPIEAQQQVADLLVRYLPEAEHLVQLNLRALWEGRGAARAIAFGTLAWTGSSVLAIVSRLLDRAWDIRQRGGLRALRRLLAVPIAVLGLGLLAVSMAVSAVARVFWLIDRLSGMISLGRIGAVTFVIAVGINVVVFALIYWVLPSKKQTFRQVLPGAIAAAILWESAKSIYTWYLSRVRLSTIVYGSVTTIIVTLTWTYITGCILLYCGELNAAYCRVRQPRKVHEEVRRPVQRPPAPDWTTDEEDAQRTPSTEA